jgi:hypothetical protein
VEHGESLQKDPPRSVRTPSALLCGGCGKLVMQPTEVTQPNLSQLHGKFVHLTPVGRIVPATLR